MNKTKQSTGSKQSTNGSLQRLDGTLGAGKISFFLLLLVWAAIRIFEGVSNMDILQSAHIYYTGVISWFLLACFVLQLMVRMIRATTCPDANRQLWWGWLGLIAVAGMLVCFHDSFRIIAIIVNGIFMGFTETVNHGFHALSRLFPWHPFVLFFAGLDQTVGLGLSGTALPPINLTGEEMKKLVVAFDVFAAALFFLPSGLRFSSILFAMLTGYVTVASFELYRSFFLPRGLALDYAYPFSTGSSGPPGFDDVCALS